jgi:hypothetical protein
LLDTKLPKNQWDEAFDSQEANFSILPCTWKTESGAVPLRVLIDRSSIVSGTGSEFQDQANNA